MKFDTYIMSELKKHAKNHTILTIKGCNGMQHSFELKGCILLDENENPFINKNSLAFFTGQMGIFRCQPIKYYINLITHPRKDEIQPDNFYIESISTDNGKNIFVNDDFDAIMRTCKRDLRDCFKYPVDADVCSFAKQILGQPMQNKYEPTVLKCLYYTEFNKFRVVTNNGSCLCSYQGSSINDIDLRKDNSAEFNLEAYSTTKKR